MKKLLMAWLCLLSTGAWAQEEEQVLSEDDPHAQRAPALWIQPLAVALLPAGLEGVPFLAEASSSEGLVFVDVPLGLTVPLNPRQDLVFELTPFYQHRIRDTELHSKALFVSVGSTWMPAPNRLGQGWFLQPKLMGVVAQVKMVNSHSGPLFDTRSTQLSLGLDVGYRVSSERLFLEFVLGLSAGYGWNVPTTQRSVIAFAIRGNYPNTFKDKVVWDYNLNLLRLGFRF